MYFWIEYKLLCIYIFTGGSTGGQQFYIRWSVGSGRHTPDCGSTSSGQSQTPVSPPASCLPRSAGLTRAGHSWPGQSYSETRWIRFPLFRRTRSLGGGLVPTREQPGALLQRRSSFGGLHSSPGASQKPSDPVCGSWSGEATSGWVLPHRGTAALWGAAA